MKKIIELPVIICGEYMHSKDDYIEIKYSNDVSVRIPKLTEEDTMKIITNPVRLEEIPLYEITRYLSDFAIACSNPENSIIRQAIEYTSLVTGYSPETIYRDYFIMLTMLMDRGSTYDIVDAELGDFHMLDEWVKVQVVKIRAYPRGRAFHVCVGNVPLATMYTIYRSIITKNQTIIKLPSRDLITGTYFVKAMIDVNGSEHPVSKALSVIYTEANTDHFKNLLQSSDVVCAWGKGESLKKIKEQIPHSIPFLECGPKRSYALIDLKNVDPDKAAIRLAHDMSIYDQEACFSPQRLFLIGNPEEFIPYLEKWLNWQEEHIHKGTVNDDAKSHLLRMKMEAMYRQWKVVQNDSLWSIIVADPFEVIEHPLGRTIFIHPINDVKEMLPFIDDETQTVSIFPYESKDLEETSHLLCSMGVSRVCEIGTAIYPRDGFTWDAIRALPYFVRFCCQDESLGTVSKGGRREDTEYYLSTVYGAEKDSEEEKQKLYKLLLKEDVIW